MPFKIPIICYFLFLSNLVCTEGFMPDTLITIPHGFRHIEKLTTKDLVLSPSTTNSQNYPITCIQKNIVNSHAIISFANTTLCSAIDQKFYSSTRKQWVQAQDLKPSEFLLCLNSSTIMVDTIEIIHASKNMFTLTIQTSHMYCVTPYKIITHNVDPFSCTIGTAILSFACPPVALISITTQAIAGTILAGISLYAAYKKHKKNKSFAQIQEELKNNNTSSPNPKKPDEEDDEHPHGIYKDAGYHHPNSRGRKSPSPKDGQRCLDYSLPYINNQRIAIEGDTFIVLKQTSPGKFHGHTIEWGDILEKMQKILQRKGYVKKSGKIINQITGKTLL